MKVLWTGSNESHQRPIKNYAEGRVFIVLTKQRGEDNDCQAGTLTQDRLTFPQRHTMAHFESYPVL
jgi:hypothetical protein